MTAKTKFELSYNNVSLKDNAVYAIVVAAGSFMRMGGVNKQLAEICGIPVVIRSLLAFENSPYISGIVLVVREPDALIMQNLCEKYSISKLKDIVCGGKDRHESVMNGIKTLPKEEKNVLIHDGARPCVTSKIIAEVAEGLSVADAAVCVIKVNDTVKYSGDGEYVEKTVDRARLYLAQTPQGVNVSKYIDACSKLSSEEFTDDASIMEQAGYAVKATLGSVKNIKITTVEDIKIAEMYIKGDEE